MTLTYRDAGVDIDAGNELVQRIRSHTESTHRPGVLGSIGGFGGLFGLREAGFTDPVLISGTDGVGTKLKIAFATEIHDTVGIDLVAMCVNDILVSCAEPLFFLDYLGTGRLEPEVGEAIVRGIATGCREAGCALIGGETAELPGMYAAGEYDLAGFAVGAVEREALPSADRVREGDVIIGLPSSGLHSNGYSLARRALLEVRGLALHEPMPGSEISLGEIMLAPTRIYVRPVLSVLKTLSASVHGMAHITGGGLVENIPRVLPEGLEIRMQWDAWDVPAIFKEVQAAGVSDTEMRRTFNLGIGFVLVVAPAEVDAVCDALRAEGETPHCIGEVTRAGS